VLKEEGGIIEDPKTKRAQDQNYHFDENTFFYVFIITFNQFNYFVMCSIRLDNIMYTIVNKRGLTHGPQQRLLEKKNRLKNGHIPF
jgi:hypothetical protein